MIFAIAFSPPRLCSILIIYLLRPSGFSWLMASPIVGHGETLFLFRLLKISQGFLHCHMHDVISTNSALFLSSLLWRLGF